MQASWVKGGLEVGVLFYSIQLLVRFRLVMGVVRC